MATRRLTLGQVFALMMIGLALLLALLFTVLLEGSRRSIIQAAISRGELEGLPPEAPVVLISMQGARGL